MIGPMGRYTYPADVGREGVDGNGVLSANRREERNRFVNSGVLVGQDFAIRIGYFHDGIKVIRWCRVGGILANDDGLTGRKRRRREIHRRTSRAGRVRFESRR